MLFTLDLSNCSIDYLDVNSFAHLTSLNELNLSENSISVVEYGLFSHLSELKKVNFSYNQIQEIDFHVFSSYDSLKSLDLSGNYLSRIQYYDELKSILPSLFEIGLEKKYYWDCRVISDIHKKLRMQGISIIDAIHPVKNETNFRGIGCNMNYHEYEDRQSENSVHHLYIAILESLKSSQEKN